MDKDIITTGKLGSRAEDLFMELFCDRFGPEKSRFIFTQYPFVDIYGNRSKETMPLLTSTADINCSTLFI